MLDVRTAWEHARAACPGVIVSEEEFQEIFARFCTPHEGENSLEKPPSWLAIAPDVYLAHACARNDANAIALFEQRFAGVVEAVRGRFGARAPANDEVWSELRVRLFVPKSGQGTGKIAEYEGRAALSAWLRVVVLRMLLNRLEAQKPEVPFEERVLEGLLVTEASPDIVLHRTEQRELFKKALGTAAAKLAPRDRRLLRLAFAEGFTIDDLGALHGVHRATAARWIQSAIAALGTQIKAIVRAELGLSATEYESWKNSVASKLDVSLAKYLASDEAPGK